MREVVRWGGDVDVDVGGTSLVMRAKMEVGVEVSAGGGEVRGVVAGLKAALSIFSNAAKSAFVRKGEMLISFGEVEGFLAGRIKMICS